MGLLSSFLNPTPQADAGHPRGPADDFWFDDLLGRHIGHDERRARQNRAVFSCVRVRSESMAILPWMAYKRRKDGGKERATDHWLYRLLHDRPNDYMTPFDLKQMISQHLDYRGIFAAYKVPGKRMGEVSALIPLHPDRLDIVQAGTELNPRFSYNYRTRLGAPVQFAQDELFTVWFAHESDQGMWKPLSVLSAAARAINLAIVAEDHGQRFFENDARASVVVINKAGWKTAEDRDKDRDALQRRQTGPNRYKVMLLGGETDVKQLSLSNEDAQYLETRKFQVSEVAGMFRVPLHMIGDLERSTNNNIEHQGIQWARLDLMPTLKRTEEAADRDLAVEPEVFTEFLVDALERGDIKSRYEAHNMAVSGGWKTRNEARIAENMNPLPGLDEPLEPLNMRRANDRRAQAIVERQVKRVVRQEVEAVTKLARKHGDDQGEWVQAVHKFYQAHALELHNVLSISLTAAAAYAEDHREQVLSGGITALESFMQESEARLLALIMEEDDAPETDVA